MAKLTKRTAGEARPRAVEWVLWDSITPGFGLRVRPSGARTWMLLYRSGRRVRRLTLGSFDKVALDVARAEARRALGEIARGGDPARERALERGQQTVAELCERFVKEHVKPYLKPSTARDVESQIDGHVKPALGRLAIAQVIRDDVARLHRSLAETPYRANRVLATLSRLFRFAEEVGLRPEGTNPARGLRHYPERRRERFLSDQELARLGEVLREAEREQSEPWQAVAAIRLLVLTGCRMGEVLGLRWDEVDAERGLLHLSDSKTGARPVYLSAEAISVFEDLPSRRSRLWVLPGRGGQAPFVGLPKRWAAIRRRAGLEDVRIHDIRHSHASIGAGLGLSLPIIGKLLGHTQPSTTSRYAHLAADPVREAARRVGGRIAAVLDGRPDAPVVPLRDQGGGA